MSKDSLLSYFWDLPSLDQKTREKATSELINNLEQSKDKDALMYTFQRLVKGLSSSRKAARQGYSTALVHCLASFHDEVSLADVLDLIYEHLVTGGGLKSQEERDVYFGRVFGNLAISKYLEIRNYAVEQVCLKKVVENLLKLMNKKSYLREICSVSICQIVTKISTETFEENVQDVLKNILGTRLEDATAEDFMINITVTDSIQSIADMKENWDIDAMFESNKLKKLSNILMTTTEVTHPRVHAAWPLFMSKITKSTELFTFVWKEIVEGVLLVSSHQRKYLAMQLFVNLAPQMTGTMAEIVFGKPLLKCIINSCQSKENFLYKAARDMLDKLHGNITADENVIFSVIQLLIKNGSVLFDSLTKTKTVESLSRKLKNKVDEYFVWLQSVFVRGSVGQGTTDVAQKDKDSCRRWALNQLIITSHNCKVENNEDIALKIARFLFMYGHFEVLKKNKTVALLKEPCCEEIGSAITELAKQRFKTLMSDLSNWNMGENKGTKQRIGGVTSDGHLFTLKILQFAKKLMELPKCVRMLEAWTPKKFDIFNDVLNSADINNDSETLTNNKGVQLIIQHATLQLFEHDEEAVDVLQDIRQCFKKSEEKSNKGKKKTTEPHWTEVLCEVLLVFLSKPSHLMRHVVDVTFQTVAPYLTTDALDSILKVLKPKSRGSEHEDFDIEDDEQNKAASKKSDPGEESKDGSDSDEDGKESKDGESDEKDEDSEDGSENSEEDDTEGSEDESTDVDTHFKMKIQKALGMAHNQENGETGAGGNDDSDIDMDTCDPELLNAMDETLSDIFQQKKRKDDEKKQRKSVNESIVHFKLRVLDLLEVFIKTQPKDPKIFLLLKPLLDVINISQKRSNEATLHDKSVAILQQNLCQHKPPLPELCGSEAENVHQLIEDLILRAKRNSTSPSSFSCIKDIIIYLIKVLRGSPEQKTGPSPLKTRSQRKRTKPEIVITKKESWLDAERLQKCLVDALGHFMLDKSSKIQPVLFEEIINRYPELGWQLGMSLPMFLASACNNFRQAKCSEFLTILLARKVPEHEAHLTEIKDQLSINLVKAFQSLIQDSCTLKSKHVRDVINLSSKFLSTLSMYPSIQLEASSELTSSFETAIESTVVKRSPTLQTQLKKLITLSKKQNNTLQHSPSKKKKKKSKQ